MLLVVAFTIFFLTINKKKKNESFFDKPESDTKTRRQGQKVKVKFHNGREKYMYRLLKSFGEPSYYDLNGYLIINSVDNFDVLEVVAEDVYWYAMGAYYLNDTTDDDQYDPLEQDEDTVQSLSDKPSDAFESYSPPALEQHHTVSSKDFALGSCYESPSYSSSDSGYSSPSDSSFSDSDSGGD